MLFYAALIVLFLSMAHDGDCNGQQQGYWETDWMKISGHTVCLEAKHNRYGSFNNYVRAGRVTAIKLEYVSGEVRCINLVEYNSRWGCKGYAPFKKFPLNIVVTDNNDNVLFPKQEYIKHTAGLWYWLPFVSATDSDELIFTDYRFPFFFPKGKEMRIWYGEDLKNWGEGDNGGRVCVDVYVKFLPY